MGLYKQIEAGNGVPLSYHRVVSITIVVNNQNVVEVASYTSQAKRAEEQQAMEQLRKGDNDALCDVFIDTQYLAFDYDPSMTVETAYEALKGLDEFSDAEDVLDDAKDEKKDEGVSSGKR